MVLISLDLDKGYKVESQHHGHLPPISATSREQQLQQPAQQPPGRARQRVASDPRAAEPGREARVQTGVDGRGKTQIQDGQIGGPPGGEKLR